MNQRLVVQSGTFLVPGVLHEPVEDIVCGLRGGRAALRKLVLNSTALEKDGRTLREKAHAAPLQHEYHLRVAIPGSRRTRPFDERGTLPVGGWDNVRQGPGWNARPFFRCC
jgi:hypothetical protein